MHSPMLVNCVRKFGVQASLFLVLYVVPGTYAADKKMTVSSASASSSNALRSPVLGFIAPVEAPKLRPIIGAFGAAVLGEEVPLPDKVTRLIASPAGDFVLAETSDGEPISVLRVEAGGAGPLQPIAEAFSRSDAVGFSASGHTVALYSVSLRRIQIVTGLPESPAMVQQYDVSALPPAVISLAVNDDASLLLVGAADVDGGGVFRMTSDRAAAKVMGASKPAGLRLLPGADSAVVTDTDFNRVVLISALNGEPTIKQLAGAEDGADGPNQIELLGGGRAVVVANLNTDSLLLITLEHGKISQVPITGRVADLRSMRTGGGVTIHTTAPEAYWIISGAGDSAAISLISDAAEVADHQ